MDGKQTKRAGAKTSKDVAAKKVRKTLHLSAEAFERLAIHAAKTREDASAIVDRLILDNLRSWRVSRWGGGASDAPPAESTTDAA